MLYTIIIFILVLSVIVFAHELGHFASARIFGLKPQEFGFGMPPRIFGIYKSKSGKWKRVWGRKKVEDNADTVYSVNALPLGGFVNLGEDDGSSEDPNHFHNKKRWQKAVILSAGVVMNIVLAAVLFGFGYLFGLPQQTENLPNYAKVSNEQVQIIQVYEGSPAEEAGLYMADIILEIDGSKIDQGQDLSPFFSEREGQEVPMVVKHLNEEKSLTVIPEVRDENGRVGIGISYITSGTVKYPWYLALWEGFKAAFIMLWAIIIAFVELIKGLFVGSEMAIQVAGPVGIADITGQMARLGFSYLLQFTALISLNLAVINFLPLPALDGGRVLVLALEKITGRTMKKEIEAGIHNIGFLLLILLFLFITFKDVLRLFN